MKYGTYHKDISSVKNKHFTVFLLKEPCYSGISGDTVINNAM